MSVRRFLKHSKGRKCSDEQVTIADLTTSLRESLTSFTIGQGITLSEDDYNGDIEDNEDLPDIEDDLTDIDNMRAYVKEKQSNILNHLNYEPEQNQQDESSSVSRQDKESSDNPA